MFLAKYAKNIGKVYFTECLASKTHVSTEMKFSHFSRSSETAEFIKK